MRPFQAEKVPRKSWPELWPYFTAAQHLSLEIGAGQGLHAIRYCSLNPNHHLIAVERTHERFAKMAQRHSRHAQLKNLMCVHADAVSVVTHWLWEHSLDQIFLLYPNPYPKAKQTNQRWHNAPFMSCLRSRLKPGGRIVLSTNVASYAHEASQKMQEVWGFQLLVFEPFINSPRTHFEKKYLERGETCWTLVFISPPHRA